MLLHNLKIESVSLHFVGNKINDEDLILSDDILRLDNTINTLLKLYFTSSFKIENLYNLFHENDIKYNEIYGIISDIFDNPKTFHNNSKEVAKLLFSKSIHPQIKGGELYVAHLKDCEIENKIVDAIGIFKSETKDTFLKVDSLQNRFNLKSETGINLNKLDKGCIIFNTEKNNGYIVACVDNTNKKNEALYWTDSFLQLRDRNDQYYNTHNWLSLYKKFIAKELPKEFDISKAEQVDLLNKSITYFKEKEQFNIEDFAREVIVQDDIMQSFGEFSLKYQKEHDINLTPNFSISIPALKKQTKVFKSMIKLDKNFDIHIYGNTELIEKGIDSDGRKYYKIYYQEEN